MYEIKITGKNVQSVMEKMIALLTSMKGVNFSMPNQQQAQPPVQEVPKQAKKESDS